MKLLRRHVCQKLQQNNSNELFGKSMSLMSTFCNQCTLLTQDAVQ